MPDVRALQLKPSKFLLMFLFMLMFTFMLVFMQLNRDLVGYFDSRRPEVVLEAPDKPFDFAWPQPEPLRAVGPSGSLLQLKGVSYTYPGAPAPVLHVSHFRTAQ